MGDETTRLHDLADIAERWLLAIGYFGTQAFVAMGGLQEMLA